MILFYRNDRYLSMDKREAIDMTIRHLTIFVAVAESGVYERRCGASLYLSQPTVSQAIRELEKHYQWSVFLNVWERSCISQIGDRLLLPQAQEADPAVPAAGGTDAGIRGSLPTLKLGSTITVGTCLTPLF